MKYIGGVEEVINNIKMHGNAVMKRVGEAVEKAANLAANRAKADHIRGQAHAQNRYENQTTTLTKSITPKLKRLNIDIAEAEIFTNMEYAYRVETIYPYMWPAVIATQGDLKKLLKEAGYGNA